MSDQHLRSLLDKLETLTPLFGRARPDLEAIVSRAKNADYRGVLQNSRLVVETLLRAMMLKEKKQDPGKAMLDQLLSKLYQAGKPSLLPTHIVVHMRTIQAWGNVGAHDQGVDLFAEGAKVSLEEARSSLGALLVILEWYKDEHLEDLASGPSSPASPAKVPASKPDAPAKIEKSKAPLYIVGAVLIATAATAAVAFRGGKGGKEVPADRTPLDAAYKAAAVPLPPLSCPAPDSATISTLSEAMKLLSGGKYNSDRPEDKKALKMLEALSEKQRGSAEYWAMLARARLHTNAGTAPVLTAVSEARQRCDTYAVPHNLKGHLHIHNGELDAAQKAYERAAGFAKGYVQPRFNLGLVHMKGGKTDEAIRAYSEALKIDGNHAQAYQWRGAMYLSKKMPAQAKADLERAIELEPKAHFAHYMMGNVLTVLKDEAGAMAAYCKAKALGSKQAKCATKE